MKHRFFAARHLEWENNFELEIVPLNMRGMMSKFFVVVEKCHPATCHSCKLIYYADAPK